MSRSIRICGMLIVSTALGFPGSITQVIPTLTATSTGGGVLYLPQFNSALGTLTGVQLNFSVATISAAIGMTDLENNTSSINITYNLGYGVDVALPGNPDYNPQAFSALTCSATGAGAELLTCSNSGNVNLQLGSQSFDLSSQKQLFLIGPVGLTYSASLIKTVFGTPIPNPPSNLNLVVSNESFSMPGTITFTYSTPTSIPEPAAFATAAGGLIFIALIELRRRTRRATT